MGVTACALIGLVGACGSGKERGAVKRPIKLPHTAAGRLVFADEGDLVAIAPDGTRRARLTHTDAIEMQPEWSPDGRRVVFVRGDGGIYVMNADGSAIRRVTTARETEAPAWSPDGRRIAFGARSGHGFAIYVVNADGSGRHRIFSRSVGWVGEPAWSPDARRMAIAVDPTETGGETDLYVIDAQGRHPRRISGTAGDEGSPAWSSDGRRILFGSGGDGVFTVRPDGTKRRRIVGDRLNADTLSPAWSPDERQIVFTGKFEGDTSSAVYVVNADGTHLHAVTGRLTAPTPVDW